MTRRKFILFLIAFSALIPEVSRTANSPIPQTPARGIVVAAGGGGDLTWTELTQGSDTTTEPTTTASITPAANDDVFVAVVVAVEGGGTTGNSDTMTISGANLTWTQIRRNHYGASGESRRSIYVFHGKGAAPTTGALTIDFTSGHASTWTEHMWSVDQVDNAHTTTPYSNAADNGSSTGVTSLAVTVGGTVDTGDHVYFAIGHEFAEAVTLESGLTSLSAISNGTDGRTIDAAYDGTAPIDQTPSASWTTSSTCGAVAFIVEKAP